MDSTPSAFRFLSVREFGHLTVYEKTAYLRAAADELRRMHVNLEKRIERRAIADAQEDVPSAE
jgi:hypothetical protein